MKFLTSLFLTFFLFGCSPPKIIHKHPTPVFKPKSYFDSCKYKKTLTTEQLVSVVFWKCGVPEINVFAIVIYEPQSMRLAGIKAAMIIHKELGYTPTLGLIGKLMISDKYGVVYPLMIFIQTGRVIE